MGGLSQFCLFLYVSYHSGPDDFLVDVFHEATFWSTGGEGTRWVLALAAGFVFRFGRSRLFSLSVC